MKKHVDDDVMEELENYYMNIKEFRKSPNNMKLFLNKLLQECGFDPMLVGYDFLVQAAIACYLDKSMLKNKSKVLYPYLAEKNGVTPASIEKDIRTVIRCAWRSNDSKYFYGRTNCFFIEDGRRPTCGMLIDILENFLRDMLWDIDM